MRVGHAFRRILAGTMLLVAACGNDDDSAPTARASATPPVTASPTVATTPTIDPAALPGVYDLRATSTQREFSGVSIGVVTLVENGGLRLELDFDVDNDIEVDATFLGPDQIVASGWGTFQGDIGFQAEGTGLVQIDDHGSRRITGSIQADGFLNDAPVTVDFTLERPQRPNLIPFAGRYRFDFGSSPSGCDGASHATFDLRFGDDGHGESRTIATDRGNADTVYGRFLPGSCRLAPSGLFRCSLQYEHACHPPPPWDHGIRTHGLRVTGQLVRGSGSVVGAGRVETTGFIYFLGGHSWTAHRLP